eukprot:TRINITY_DN43520_c0_g1_i1.p1 TRINITY_DN43520_c0_g1~~TRINITY_DN43520_c0_g1_i1.p1  ORF type:complete len:405 (+),score=39.16 TRINITY_DN43520_c0_g1_i1:69-1283(+)
MVQVEYAVTERGGGRSIVIRFDAEWEPEGIDEVEVRRGLMPLVVGCRGVVRNVLREDCALEDVVGTCVGWGRDSDGSIRFSFETDGESFKDMFGDVECDALPAWTGETHPVPTAKSHLGEIPLMPPLQVFFGARPFFTKDLLSNLQPALSTITSWCTQRTTYHYSRFQWQPDSKRPFWCKTYLYYSSPDPTGPLNLYPLYEEGTLAGDPCGVGGFHPNYVVSEVREGFFNEADVLLAVGNVTEEMGKMLMRPEWEGFCTLCEKHGLARPEPMKMLDIGLEKTLIPLLYFAPLAPILGFTYTHTFSTVPEPQTICLTCVPASRGLTPTRSPMSGYLLSVAKATYQDEEHPPLSESEVADELRAIPPDVLKSLMRHRCVGMDEVPDSAAGEYLRKSFNPNASKYKG